MGAGRHHWKIKMQSPFVLVIGPNRALFGPNRALLGPNRALIGCVDPEFVRDGREASVPALGDRFRDREAGVGEP